MSMIRTVTPNIVRGLALLVLAGALLAAGNIALGAADGIFEQHESAYVHSSPWEIATPMPEGFDNAQPAPHAMPDAPQESPARVPEAPMVVATPGTSLVARPFPQDAEEAEHAEATEVTAISQTGPGNAQQYEASVVRGHNPPREAVVLTW